MNNKVLILAGKGESTNIVFHALEKDYNIVKVIEEEPVDQITFLKRRIAKLGILKVLGQVLFKIFIVKYLSFSSQDRIKEIKTIFMLDDSPIPSDLRVNVTSINSAETIALIKEINPAVIIVNGTRIISKRVLESAPATFINTHAGITPLYRGVHGGYWALANHDRPNCGVTVHLVDTGIDTGNILYQALIYPSQKDNFITYPLLQIAEGLVLLRNAIQDILSGQIKIKQQPSGTSRLWYHPTILEYLINRFRYNIK